MSSYLFHAPAWRSKGVDVQRSVRGECRLCRALKDGKQCVGGVGNLGVLINTKPYFPGHILLVPGQHTNQIDAETLELLQRIREHLPQHVKMYANIGWYAGQSLFHLHIHVIPDVEHVRKDFAEPLKQFLARDKTNEKIAKAVGGAVPRNKMWAIPVPYNVKALQERLSAIAEVQKELLEPVELPYLPSVHLEFADKVYIYPRGGNPPGKRLAILELFYNSLLSRDLEGEEERRFWRVAEKENKKILNSLKGLYGTLP